MPGDLQIYDRLCMKGESLIVKPGFQLHLPDARIVWGPKDFLGKKEPSK